MTRINRQRYMAELSKLLAFMFKEDKEDILAHYNKMLDEAEDEQALLEELGSPTKLAVTISRTYKRDERKLSVEAESKEVAQSAPLEFGSKTAEAPAAKEPEPDAPSYADIIEEIRREMAEEQGIEYTPIFFNEPEPPVVEDAPVVEEAPVEEEAPAEEDASVVEETPVVEGADNILDELESTGSPVPETVYKTNAALLVLYLIFAIPIGLVLLVLAAVVGLTLLAATVGIAVLSFKVVGFAASTLAVFADVMLCIGAALISAAVGLMLLWLALLTLIKGIPGLCRGIVALGRKFCVKEVGVND